MDNIVLEVGAAEMLPRVEPLWEELNAYHVSISPAFTLRYTNMNFASRQQGLLKKSAEGALWVGVARVANGPDIGYCMASIDKQQQAEVDSLFIKSEYRKRGIGEALMRAVLVWMDDYSTAARVIMVVAGNEEAFPFYARFGFAPRAWILQHIERNEQGD